VRRAVALGVALALLTTHASFAAAPDLSPAVRLQRAQVCYRVDDLVCAGDELAAARARRAELDDAGRIELERLTAATALAAGEIAAAGAALDALLGLDPGWIPPESASSAFRDAWAEARRRADLSPPRLAVTAPPDRVRAGESVKVEAAASDPSGVDRVVLHVAMADGTVVDLAMPPSEGGHYRGTVPAELVVVPEVRLWVEAWDALGNGPARWGDRDAPQRVAVLPREEEGGLTSKWWFWTAVGAGAVATGVILAVALSGGGGSDGGDDTGSFSFDLELP